MRICCIPGSKLARALRREGTLGVAARTGIAPCASREDGCFAGREGCRRHKEDELEALRERHGKGGLDGLCVAVVLCGANGEW